ncbi:hypothetical protein [Natronobacterium gregoryi]|uniref:hypothetical protein n=1 Tax=Natronobacterium gregoryi TaxID=44930 RepID=UPI001375DBB9|nr:hypothetical protein [Natronobacterium gregoryi]
MSTKGHHLHRCVADEPPCDAWDRIRTTVAPEGLSDSNPAVCIEVLAGLLAP